MTDSSAVPSVKQELTAERVRQLLDYDRDTGVFRWKWRPAMPAAWNARFAGKVAGAKPGVDGYRKIGLDRGRYLASRFAWLYVTGEWPPALVAHKNRIRSDDRFENLYCAATLPEILRRYGGRPLEDVGVRLRRRKWSAHIYVAGRQRWLGSFATKQAAVDAYAAAAAARDRHDLTAATPQ